ncbi:MAG: hypothetical protein M3068_07815 [Gemmatimonadota bacterium]|nr:hypothetical protein [Gemmatimonadota bacterium]
MRLAFLGPLIASTMLVLGCSSDKTTKPTTPVTVKFTTPAFGTDTVRAEVVMDGTVRVTLPGDSILSVARGTHSFVARLSIDYLPHSFTFDVNPSGNVAVVPIYQAPSCRIILYDGSACSGRNAINWQQHTLIFCPTSDFGEVCTVQVDPGAFGATWPDSGFAVRNAYVYHGKLLIAALRPRSGGSDTLAMALYIPGDYLPHVRLHPIPGDSTRWQEDVWTDGRHVPIYPALNPALAVGDRPGQNFGLDVRITALLPPTEKNAMLVRFDVTNISATDSFRFVHREEPAAGHTLTDIYLAPFWDANIGGIINLESIDDNSTLFPAESLLVTYDQRFTGTTMSASFAARPGLFGLRLIDGPPGTTAKGIVTSAVVSAPIWYDLSPAVGRAREDSSYALLSAGRAQPINSLCVNSSVALVCDTESSNNTYTGWSVGPISSLAPGQSTSITVALLFAPPDPGTFTSGTDMPPQNNALGSTTRPIYITGGGLRALAAQLKSLRVDGTPGAR